MDILSLTPEQQIRIINNRWSSSASVWEIVKKVTDKNQGIYRNEPEWMDKIPARKNRVKDNRIFRNMETMIANSLKTLPTPNVIPGSDTPESKELGLQIQRYFLKKYDDLDVKQEFRRSMRRLFITRMFCLKVFWDPILDDFNLMSVDPKNIRVSKNATKEAQADFVIEEVTKPLSVFLDKFPEKKEAILAAATGNEISAYEDDKDVTWREAWIGNAFIVLYANRIIKAGPNPYWDWDGIEMSQSDQIALANLKTPQEREKFLANKQNQRVTTPATPPQSSPETTADQPNADTKKITKEAYYFNHFSHPRKPYIWGTLFAVDESPIGDTDLISQTESLLQAIGERKRDIGENAQSVNGLLKVDSGVMTRGEAEKIRFEPKGMIYGKNVNKGVTREFGTPMPQFVFEDMQDSRAEIDQIMGTNLPFKGFGSGHEAMRSIYALIQQSLDQLTEFNELLEFVSAELYNWWFQLMKVKYTEAHLIKDMGKNDSLETISLMRNQFEDGIQIQIIPGKLIPNDAMFKMQQAQEDMKAGILDPVTYFEMVGYDDPKTTAKAALAYKLNPLAAVGMDPQEAQELMQGNVLNQPKEEDKVSKSISFKDLPVEGQVQLAKQAGIDLSSLMQPSAGTDDTLARVQKITSSPQFQQLPVEKQQQIINTIKQLTQ